MSLDPVTHDRLPSASVTTYYGGRFSGGSTACLSPDGLYRYSLTRSWGNGPRATFVMLNPSTADASMDDPTIRRCIGFAKSWQCTGIAVVNLYALRSTDPKALWRSPDPVGPDNDAWLRAFAYDAAEQGWPLVAAWGANARPARVVQVLRLPRLRRILQALGTTKNGSPRHPLYLRSDAALSPWPVAS